MFFLSILTTKAEVVLNKPDSGYTSLNLNCERKPRLYSSFTKPLTRANKSPKCSSAFLIFDDGFVCLFFMEMQHYQEKYVITSFTVAS